MCVRGSEGNVCELVLLPLLGFWEITLRSLDTFTSLVTLLTPRGWISRQGIEVKTVRTFSLLSLSQQEMWCLKRGNAVLVSCFVFVFCLFSVGDTKVTVDRASLLFSSLQYFFARWKTGEKSISRYWFLMGLNTSADFLVGLFWQTGCPCTDGDSRAWEPHSAQQGLLWGPCAELSHKAVTVLSCSMYYIACTRDM